MIKLVVGLGNPDQKFKNTYHNVGQLFVDFLQEKLGFKEIGADKGKITDIPKTQKPLLFKSLTYMNRSGEGIKDILKKLKISPDNVLVVHDDSDIEIGRSKISFDRNSGGHKGVESIIKTLKTKKFWRLRIGIRPRQSKNTPRPKAGEFVLKNITPSQKEKIYSVFGVSAEKIIEKEKP